MSKEIPKILHQGWTDADVPPRYHGLMKGWKTLHPEWLYRLWTSQMRYEFISEHFAGFLPIYNSYPKDIQRIDAARYFILLKMGGLHIDLDFQCFRNIDPLISTGHQCIFGKEPVEHCLQHQKSLIISNAFMACSPDSLFMAGVCSKLAMNDGHHNFTTSTSVLESTGPFMLTKMYLDFHGKDSIKLLEPETIFPLTKQEIFAPVDIRTFKAKTKHSYAIHYYEGSWWRKKDLLPPWQKYQS